MPGRAGPALCRPGRPRQARPHELQRYGYRPFEDEPDPRPLPEGPHVAGAIAEMFDALAFMLHDTRLEPDLENLLWGEVNLFHRAAERVEREFDDNEQAQKRLQREQDGSEVRSVELERALAEGLTLLERRDAFELMRDTAVQLYERHTRSAWRPRSGSLVTCKTLSAAGKSLTRRFGPAPVAHRRQLFFRALALSAGERKYKADSLSSGEIAP